jgi:GxxExxY protein
VGLIDHPANSTTDKTIGAAIEVHRHLGPGLLESSYHACLCHELDLRGVSYQSQATLPIEYKGAYLERGYVIDLLVEKCLVVEIKAVEKLLPIHACQLMTYMRLQRISCALLLSFNVSILPKGIKRVLL